MAVLLLKHRILENPQDYPWNAVLFHVQFSQEELLQVRDHVDLYAMIRHQQCLTREFLKTHFLKEIQESDDTDWTDVVYYVPLRI